MKLIVDTNVPVVANGASASPQAGPKCVRSCVSKVREIQLQHILILDDGWHIVREYMRKLASSGQPGVGDAFLKWVLTNRANPQRCEIVHITPRNGEMDPITFIEFPDDDALIGFDRSDHKFVATSISHPERPPILNAVDTDWWDYRVALQRHGVRVEFLCPETMTADHSS
jgi:hypothetical protein